MSRPPGPAAGAMRRLAAYLRPYRTASVLAPVLMLLEVSMDLMQPRLLASLIDHGVMAGDLAHIAATGALMLLCAACGFIGGFGCTFYSSKAAVGFGSDLRDAAFAATQRLSFRQLDRLQTASLVTRLGSDVAQLQQFVMMLLRGFVRSPLLLLGSVAMAVLISPALALVLLAGVPLLAAVLYGLIRWSVPRFAGVQRHLDRLTQVLRENLAGMRTVKAFVRGHDEARRFQGANDAYRRASVGAWRVVTLNVPAMSLILNAIIVAVLWFGGLRSVHGGLSAGELVAFVNYATVMLSSLNMLGTLLMSFARAQVSAVRVAEVLAEAATATPTPVTTAATATATGNAAATQPGEATAGRCTLPAGPLSLAFEHVGLHHDASRPATLHDITLALPAGRTLAIFGATGAGKSSLAALLPRLYEADQGCVRVGGCDVTTVDEPQLRRRIAYVQQETVLFSGTVRSNLRFGHPEADDDAVFAAARAAQADDFIRRLPDGYDTVLGQRGATLSGGQQQRIAIARALLTRPSLLILDDSTSALDARTEARLLAALRDTLPDCTLVLIAQRLNAARLADRVAVLDAGRLVACGTHAALLAHSEAYRQIQRSQQVAA